jgi:16S rRNA (cytosine967-C5)-methyltransferase
VAALPEWLPTALCLAAPQQVSDLPGFLTGAVSVQDAASQFAAELLDVQPGMRVLDACAAPGGKTGHLLERTPELGELVALDVSARRLERVKENLERLSLTATLLQGDLLEPDNWWDGRQFERILMDAPCSATGVIRRHPDIRYLRGDADIIQLAEQQLAMLKAIWPLLQPGGYLLYSTCSVLQAENAQVVDAFLADQPDATSVDLSTRTLGPDARSAGPGMQLLPDAQATDGFYYALMMRKPA